MCVPHFIASVPFFAMSDAKMPHMERECNRERKRTRELEGNEMHPEKYSYAVLQWENRSATNFLVCNCCDPFEWESRNGM